MVNAIIENMTSVPKKKNLLGGEEEKTPSNPEKAPLSVEGFLDQMGIETERRGKAVYVYADSLETVKKMIEKMPLPNENEYVIIPLGTLSQYSVFIMVTARNTSIRIGYGKNSIPFMPALHNITEKLSKITKELGIENAKSGKNLIGD